MKAWHLVPNGTFEVLKISQRQIEGAGTVCNALWFDQARIFYVPASVLRDGPTLLAAVLRDERF